MRWLLTLLLRAPAGCDLLWSLPGLSKSYTHPTYGFSLRVPRSWEIIHPGEPLSTAVALVSPAQGKRFRTNVNVVIDLPRPNQDLARIGNLSVKQLRILLNEFELLSRGPKIIQDFPALELRGRFQTTEGGRIVRSITFLYEDRQYVITLTTEESKELDVQSTFDRILRSFRVNSG